jgi:hypothetical protein
MKTINCTIKYEIIGGDPGDMESLLYAALESTDAWNLFDEAGIQFLDIDVEG